MYSSHHDPKVRTHELMHVSGPLSRSDYSDSDDLSPPYPSRASRAYSPSSSDRSQSPDSDPRPRGNRRGSWYGDRYHKSSILSPRDVDRARCVASIVSLGFDLYDSSRRRRTRNDAQRDWKRDRDSDIRHSTDLTDDDADMYSRELLPPARTSKHKRQRYSKSKPRRSALMDFGIGFLEGLADLSRAMSDPDREFAYDARLDVTWQVGLGITTGREY
ncbi:hypothetical protein F5Y17DRAFT_332132 [Xylariaceae sp. FL0594]|nr:hypothetical protein F5Y17DRAFT_332132 [Xylariaceae sp. FL0594]